MKNIFKNLMENDDTKGRHLKIPRSRFNIILNVLYYTIYYKINTNDRN